MKIQSISGHFNPKDALAILTQMVHTNIHFHESRISQSDGEEDIKTREERIKHLQRQLYEVRKFLEGTDPQNSMLSVDATLTVSTYPRT